MQTIMVWAMGNIVAFMECSSDDHAARSVILGGLQSNNVKCCVGGRLDIHVPGFVSL